MPLEFLLGIYKEKQAEILYDFLLACNDLGNKKDPALLVIDRNLIINDLFMCSVIYVKKGLENLEKIYKPTPEETAKVLSFTK